MGFQSAPGPESLRHLQPGREITIGVRGGESIRARYVGTGETAGARTLRLRRDGEPIEVAWKDVRWIRTVPAWKSTLPAFALGLAVDILIFRAVLNAYGRGTDL